MESNPQEQQMRPEDMPEFQDVLSQHLIKGIRKDFPDWSDERIIEELQLM